MEGRPSVGCRGVITEGGVVNLVDEDTEESGCPFIRVSLEPGVNLDDECGGHDGEQTTLRF